MFTSKRSDSFVSVLSYFVDDALEAADATANEGKESDKILIYFSLRRIFIVHSSVGQTMRRKKVLVRRQ